MTKNENLTFTDKKKNIDQFFKDKDFLGYCSEFDSLVKQLDTKNIKQLKLEEIEKIKSDIHKLEEKFGNNENVRKRSNFRFI